MNFLGYIADVDPGPVLVVEPRSQDAKALSKDRVAPMFRNTPCLKGKLAAVKSRDSNNTALHKVFTNGSGHITFTGAISPSGLAMRPIRYLLLDEVDRYPASAGTEGDPVALAERRTGEFERTKQFGTRGSVVIPEDRAYFDAYAWIRSGLPAWFDMLSANEGTQR